MFSELYKNIIARKAFFPVALTLLFALSAQAQTTPHYVYIPQYHTVHTGTVEPWRGHSLIAFYAGSGFYPKPVFDDVDPLDYSARIPFLATLRYAGEKNFAKTFFWGWQSNVSFLRFGYDYTLDGDSANLGTYDGVATVGRDIAVSTSYWSLTLEECLVLGYDFSECISLSASAGLFVGLLSSGKNAASILDRPTGTTLGQFDDAIDDRFGSIFDFLSLGFNLAAEVRYFVSSNIYVSLEAKLRLTSGQSNYTAPQGFDHYALLLGVGYKAFRNNSDIDDDD